MTQPPYPEAEEINWVEVTTTAGLMQAQIIAAHLQSEGIRAWAWQQSAGSALGLTVGPMGTGHVMVPEADLARAQALVDVDAQDEWVYESECSVCGTEVELDEEEVANGRFVCPACGASVDLEF